MTFRLRLLVVLTVLVPSLRAGEQPLEAEADRLLAGVAPDGPGVAVLVLRDGEPVLRKGYGLADLESKRPVRPDSSFYLASVSKHFTAIGALLLVQDGVIGVEDSVLDHFPGLPEDWEAITVQHLLTHSSGLRDHFRFSEKRVGRTNQDVLDLVVEHGELEFEPGTRYSYSNTGYVLLSMIVAEAAGQSFAEFMHERVFEPLGMSRTLVYDERRPEVADLVTGYTDGLLGPQPTAYELFTTGAGGMFSCLDDFVRWDAALAGDELLSAETRAQMLTPRIATNEQGDRHYGYGWILGEHQGLALHSHSGGLPGFATYYLRCPERRVSVVLLANKSGSPLAPIALRLLDHVLAAQDEDAEEDAEPYFPPRGSWEHRDPAELGMDAEKLAAAVAFAIEHDNPQSRDVEKYIESTLGNEPHGERIGEILPRTQAHGLVVRNGYVVAEWGPTRKVDMTFSVTKTYLSTVVGLAYDRDLIPDVEASVHELVPTEHFASERHRQITWDHLLRQTSDWRGTLFDKPDWADRPPRGASLEEMQNQPLHAPGTRYEYNDVRVNLLALAALEVWRRPLPVVLRELVMDPIGASASWRWHGYENSWRTIDGLQMQSVSGGGHWGGGMHIHSYDHARFGYLFLRQGEWDGQRILSEEWIAMARTPGPANAGYGYMNWFLNEPVPGRGGQLRKPLPSCPDTSVTFRGAGANVIYVDWDNDLVVVARWIDGQLDAFLGQVLAALEPAR